MNRLIILGLVLCCTTLSAQNFQNVVQTIKGYKGTGLVCNETTVRVGATFVEKPKDNYFKMGDNNPDPTHDVLYQLNSEGIWEKVFVDGLGNLDSYHGHNGANVIKENTLILGQGMTYSAAGSQSSSVLVQLKQGSNALIIIEKDQNGNWKFKQDLLPKDIARDARFGCDLALSGNDLIVGSHEYKYDENGKNNSGAVFIYEKSGDGNWMFKKKLTIADPWTIGIHYGETLAMNSQYLFIGCKYEYKRIDVIKYK